MTRALEGGECPHVVGSQRCIALLAVAFPPQAEKLEKAGLNVTLEQLEGVLGVQRIVGLG